MLHIRRTPRGMKPNRRERRLISFLIIATLPLIPAAFLSNVVESLYQNTFFIGFAFILTGFLLFAADRMGHGNKDERSSTTADALVVGLAQAAAVVPGLSRSGTTISFGMLRGFERSFAVKFSFLLSIPAVLGANLVSLIKVFSTGVEWSDVPMHPGRRGLRVCVGLLCHLFSAAGRPTRKIRRLLLLLLGRGACDAAAVPDFLKGRSLMAEKQTKKRASGGKSTGKSSGSRKSTSKGRKVQGEDTDAHPARGRRGRVSGAGAVYRCWAALASRVRFCRC